MSNENPQSLPHLSGYSDTRQVLATRFVRSTGREVFVLALPLSLVPSALPKPDPDEPFEGNRTVSPPHARKFADYWMENEKWTCPPIMLDTTRRLTFHSKFESNGVDLGILELPLNPIGGSLNILDGQHRTLGWNYAAADIAENLDRAHNRLLQSERLQNEIGVKEASVEFQRWQDLADRMKREFVTIELVTGISLEDHKQAFADITNNARGISKSKTVEFDSTSVINRVTREIADTHVLLAERVDFELDRVAGARNENFVSARNVSDIVRTVALGIKGRMTKPRERIYRDPLIYGLADAYFDVLVEAFPVLDAVANEDLAPMDLRRDSLLASPTILRVLAGVFHNIAVEMEGDVPSLSPSGKERAIKFFELLAPFMSAPVKEGDVWVETGFFEAGAMAPSSRSQDLAGLTDVITGWYQQPETLPFR